MTEREWQTCSAPVSMLDLLRGRACARKLRLFACACCRSVWDDLLREASRRAVEAAERLADGLATPAEVAGARDAIAQAGPGPAHHLSVPDRAAWQCLLPGAWESAQRVYGTVGLWLSGRLDWAALLRDIVGNPFRPVTAEPAWLRHAGGCVTAVAASIYAEGRFGDLPVLADALEDAGCTDEAILRHSRSGGEHARGCWVVDLVLDKGWATPGGLSVLWRPGLANAAGVSFQRPGGSMVQSARAEWRGTVHDLGAALGAGPWGPEDEPE